MKAKIPLILFIFLIPWILGAEPPTVDDPQAWKGLTPEQIERVKQGEMVILEEPAQEGQSDSRLIRCAMILDQPIDKVWELLIYTPNQEKYLSELNRAELVKRQEDQDFIIFYVKLLFISLDYQVNHHFEHDNYYMWWKLDPEYDNDLAHLEGYWRLYRIDENHTLARYGTKLVVADLIPNSIQEYLTRKNLPASLDATRKFINSGGKYRKPGYKEK